MMWQCIIFTFGLITMTKEAFELYEHWYRQGCTNTEHQVMIMMTTFFTVVLTSCESSV